jgi:solute:Na+ symporter, SSS family
MDSHILTLTIITLFYLFVTAYLGFRAYRSTKTAADFLVAGRKQHPIVMSLSYGATFISTSAIVGFGGAAATFGMGLLWLTFLNIFVGIFIAFIFFGKRTRPISHNLQAHTFPELMAKRFQSRFLQIAMGLIIFVFMPLYAAAVAIGGARFVEQSFGMQYEIAMALFSVVVAAYVLAGGLKGVMYTDAFQGAIMFLGMIALVVWTYAGLGGITAAHQSLASLDAQMPEKLAAGGMVSWASMPRFGSPMWLNLVTTIVLGVGIGVLAQPQLGVRFMTVKSNREINRGIGVGGLFILMMTGVAFVVGSLSNVYFFRDTGKVAVAAAPGGNIDTIIPLFINTYMPSWFVALFLLTLLSAAMSTLSSQFHTMGTAIGRDIYEQGLGRGRQGVSTVLVTRVGIMAAFLVSVVLAYKLPASIIAQATAVFFGLCGAAFLPLYVGCLYWRRMTRPGAIASLLVGTCASLLWLLFVQQKVAAGVGISKMVTGKDTLLALPWSAMDAQIIALPLSALTAIVVSLMTKPMASDHLNRVFSGVGPVRSGAAPQPPARKPDLQGTAAK